MRAFGGEDAPLLVVLGALDGDGRFRSARWVRPNDDREIAHQVLFWSTLPDSARQREADLVLGR